MFRKLKFFLLLVVVSCAVTEVLFGPYDKKKYCSSETLKEYENGRKNYEIAKRSIHTQLTDFFYLNQENFNKCFKKHTASRLKSRYYCVLVKLKKREKFNKIRYVSVDNDRESISSELKSCLEKEVEKVRDLSLGLYIDLTFHHPLKLSR